MRRVGIFIVMLLALLGIGQGPVLATGCEVVWVPCSPDPLAGETCFVGDGTWYDGCGSEWNYCPSGQYRAPDGDCYDIEEGSDEPVRNPPDCAWNPVSCSGSVNWESTPTISLAGRLAGCPLGNAQTLTGSCVHGTTTPEGEDICYSQAVATYSCCPAGTAVQCSTVNRNTTYQAGGPEDGYDIFIGTAQVVTSSRWGVIGNHCVNEEDGVCYGYENDYGFIYTYGTTNIYQDYDQVCSCVSNCTSVAPTAPTLTSPANGAQLSNTTVGLAWTAPTSWGTGCPSTTRTYNLYLGTVNPPTTAALSNVSEATTSLNLSGLTRGTTYYWYVQANNGSATANSLVRSFTILNDQITGQVFYDPNNTCGGSGWSTGGVSVSLDSGAGTAVSGTGTYSVTAAIGASHTLEVNIPANFACSTGALCNTCSRSGIGSPSANNNFYLTDSRESWWQAEGAGIYAGGIGGVRCQV